MALSDNLANAVRPVLQRLEVGLTPFPSDVLASVNALVAYDASVSNSAADNPTLIDGNVPVDLNNLSTPTGPAGQL